MSYENPKIPEGINVSDTNPLVDFFTMLAAVAGVLTITLSVLFFVSGYLVRFVPFSAEADIAALVETTVIDAKACHPDKERIEMHLQALANKLAIAQDTPADMPLKVHFLDTPDVNALATFGGNIYIMRGLLEQLPHENALSMVLAHEIAHIAHRDPIVATGRGAIMWLTLSLIPGLSDFGGQQILSSVTSLTALSFNRGQEETADAAALETLASYYGYTTGAEVLFEVLSSSNNEDSIKAPALFSTHPVTEDRINAIREYQAGSGHGRLLPIDRFLPTSSNDASTCDPSMQARLMEDQ